MDMSGEEKQDEQRIFVNVPIGTWQAAFSSVCFFVAQPCPKLKDCWSRDGFITATSEVGAIYELWDWTERGWLASWS